MYLLHTMTGYKQDLDSARGPVGPVSTGPVINGTLHMHPNK